MKIVSIRRSDFACLPLSSFMTLGLQIISLVVVSCEKLLQAATASIKR